MGLDWNAEKVLVIGGSGFLGANLIHFLIRERNVPAGNIRSFADRDSRALDDVSGIERQTEDILDPAQVARACDGRTVVFHAAGSTTFDPRLKKRQWLVNVEGTRNVLEAVRASRTVRRLCYTSTVNVLGCPWPQGSLGTEDACDPYVSRPRLHSFASAGDALAFADAVHESRAPRSWWKRIGIGYFDSKLAAQELVNRAARAQGLVVVSVLPGTFFGQYGELGDAAHLIKAVIENRIPGAPRGGLPLAHVNDVARGHVLAVEKGRPGALYIVSGRPEDNRRHADMMGIISLVVRQRELRSSIRTSFPVIPGSIAWTAAVVAEAWTGLCGRPAVLSRQAVRASRHLLFYSSLRAEREIGYRAEKSFREAVEAMYDSMIQRGTS